MRTSPAGRLPSPGRRASRAATLAVLLAVAGPRVAVAQSLIPTSRIGEETVDVGALAGWLDRWFDRQLADPSTGAPGAVVAVVEGDRVLLVRGFGFADLARRVPAGPGTVVRVGSVSKPVTATAVMQLVEEGRVDLRRPVSDYVRDVPLPVRFGRAVTVLDLVTHAGGYDVRLEGTAAPSDALVLPLGRYLRDHLPPQVRRAGEVVSYSNHGYALLGHLVEAVSGETFEAYAAAHVFEPLGMTASGFRLTPALERRAAVGYQRGPGGFRPALVVHPHVYPAAGLNTTAEDMARFLVAQLNGGRSGGRGVLSGASVEQMHRQQFTMAPGIPGMAFGFFEYPVRGQRALVHGGGIRGFMSGLAFWPGRRLGIFVSNNGYSDWIVRDLIAEFARRYLPVYQRPPERHESGERLERLAGSYRPLTATVGTVEKAGALRHDDLELDVDAWQRLTVGGTRFEQVGRGTFLEDYGSETLWLTERAGSGSALVVTADPVNGITAWEKVPWYETARCHREVLYVCCAIFLSVLVVWYRTERRGPAAGRRAWTNRMALVARLLLAVVAGMNLLTLGLVVGAFGSAQASGMLFGLPELARWALRLNLAAAALSVPAALGTWPVLRATAWPVRARVHFCCGAAACLAFAGWAWHWNLLGL